MKTTIRNLQKNHQVHLTSVHRLVDKLAVELQHVDPNIVWKEVILLLTDDVHITQTNREFFGKDQPTDVISFRYEAIPGETGCTGELLVNIDCAVREGPVHNGIDHELALYIAHGFNHLSGANDDTPACRTAMRHIELSWLKKWPSMFQNLILNLNPLDHEQTI